jgi:hypothetical protein
MPSGLHNHETWSIKSNMTKNLHTTFHHQNSVNKYAYLHSGSLSVWHTTHQPVFLFHTSEIKRKL